MSKEFRPLEDWLLQHVYANRETSLKKGDKVVVSNPRLSCYGEVSVVLSVFHGRTTNTLGVCTVQVREFRCRHGCKWQAFIPTDLTKYVDDSELNRFRVGKQESQKSMKIKLRKKPQASAPTEEAEDVDIVLPTRRRRRRSLDD